MQQARLSIDLDIIRNPFCYSPYHVFLLLNTDKLNLLTIDVLVKYA